MSRSKGDGRGKRISSEIMGRGTAKVSNGRIYYEIGGEDVGSASGKRDAKQDVVRGRRREDKAIVRRELAQD